MEGGTCPICPPLDPSLSDSFTIGLLLTPKKIRVFLFQFVKEGYIGCVNAIWLKHMSYSMDDIDTIMRVLYVLATITRKEFWMAIRLHGRDILAN